MYDENILYIIHTILIECHLSKKGSIDISFFLKKFLERKEINLIIQRYLNGHDICETISSISSSHNSLSFYSIIVSTRQCIVDVGLFSFL